MNIALVLSGGTGTRLGSDIPKQYIEVGGRPVISYCLERLFGCSGIDAVHIVADRAWRGLVAECMRCMGHAPGGSPAGALSQQGDAAVEVMSGMGCASGSIPAGAASRQGVAAVKVMSRMGCASGSIPAGAASRQGRPAAGAASAETGTAAGSVPVGARQRAGDASTGDGLPEKFRGFSEPGANRQLSILSGLVDIRKYAHDSDCVLIHDAARPVLSERQVLECLHAAKGHDGVVPVLPMKDTVYASTDRHTITSLLDRGSIFAGQAPELFRVGSYYEAVMRLVPERILSINGSTEPAVMAGLDIVMIPGDESNFKITTREDLENFRRVVQRK